MVAGRFISSIHQKAGTACSCTMHCVLAIEPTRKHNITSKVDMYYSICNSWAVTPIFSSRSKVGVNSIFRNQGFAVNTYTQRNRPWAVGVYRHDLIATTAPHQKFTESFVDLVAKQGIFVCSPMVITTAGINKGYYFNSPCCHG